MLCPTNIKKKKKKTACIAHCKQIKIRNAVRKYTKQDVRIIPYWQPQCAPALPQHKPSTLGGESKALVATSREGCVGEHYQL